MFYGTFRHINPPSKWGIQCVPGTYTDVLAWIQITGNGFLSESTSTINTRQMYLKSPRLSREVRASSPIVIFRVLIAVWGSAETIRRTWDSITWVNIRWEEIDILNNDKEGRKSREEFL